MPQRKSANSLTQLCAQSIANNLHKFKSPSVRRRISLPSEQDIAEDDELQSCFEGLPSQLVVSIMDAALMHCCRAPKNKDLLALLITKHLDTLDLINQNPVYCGLCGQYTDNKLDDQTVLHLLRTAALRHSPLRSLEFYLSGAVLCLLPSFPNLKKLDVSFSSGESINNDFLAQLPTCCPNLEELNVSYCNGVTDVGIAQLCGHGTGGVLPGCKSLLRLNVQGTRMIDDGARLALELLPRLQIFECDSSLIEIAAEMHRTNGTRQLNLKNLNARGVNWTDNVMVPYVRGNLINALRLCPLVVQVILTSLERLEDVDLAGFLNLNCLKNFKMIDCYEISFDGGLLPILKKFGPSSLESLTLRFVPEANIGSIMEFCSELREIHLDDIRLYSPTRSGLRSSPRHLLPHLRGLTIRVFGLDELPADQPSRFDLSLLLSSAPALESINLHGLRHLSDGIVKEAMAHHGFSKLEEFAVHCCPELTKGVVDCLLELDNPLSWIGMSCNLRLFNPSLWRAEIRENNWDLKIQYCQCFTHHLD